jgi:serine/threonine protein phosphatase PrpC
MRFRSFLQARRGTRRTNQDRVGICHTDGAVLLVVCDGMGGHCRGDIASQFVLDHLSRAFRAAATPRLKDPVVFLARAIAASHDALWAHARAKGMPEVPRTTIVAAIVQDERACWAHVGDSRLYLIRAGAVAMATRDHSHVQALLERGEISAEQAADHPDRNKIYNCVGQETPPQIEFQRPVKLRAGDVLLLSSDGFWGAAPMRPMLDLLGCCEIDAALTLMMNAAELAGGSHCDNVSVAALRALPGFESRMTPVLATPMETRLVTDEDVDASIALIGWGMEQDSAGER